MEEGVVGSLKALPVICGFEFSRIDRRQTACFYGLWG